MHRLAAAGPSRSPFHLCALDNNNNYTVMPPATDPLETALHLLLPLARLLFIRRLIETDNLSVLNENNRKTALAADSSSLA